MSGVVSRWHTLALLALSACFDSGSSKTDPKPRQPATAGTGSTGFECLGLPQYVVRNLRGEELRLHATTRPSIPSRNPIDETIAAGQEKIVAMPPSPSSEHCMEWQPSELFSTLRITAGDDVVYEGVKDADWREVSGTFTLVIWPRVPAEPDDGGVDEDAGR